MKSTAPDRNGPGSWSTYVERRGVNVIYTPADLCAAFDAWREAAPGAEAHERWARVYAMLRDPDLVTYLMGVRAETAGVDRQPTGRTGDSGGAEGTPAEAEVSGSSPDTPYPDLPGLMDDSELLEALADMDLWAGDVSRNGDLVAEAVARLASYIKGAAMREQVFHCAIHKDVNPETMWGCPDCLARLRRETAVMRDALNTITAALAGALKAYRPLDMDSTRRLHQLADNAAHNIAPMQPNCSPQAQAAQASSREG